MTTTHLDRFGRVLIPKEIRRQLGFKFDDELEIRVTRDGACLSLASHRRILDYRDRVLVYYGEAEGDLSDDLFKVPWKG